jgi:hypothetical protein
VIDVLVFDPLQQDCYLAPDADGYPPDFAGDDSCKIDRDECKDDSRTYYASDLADYMGTGQVIFETSATSEWGIIEGGNVFIVDDSQIGHEICITYEYQPFVCIDDTVPPVMSVSATPNVLWPPNHKYRRISKYVE